MTSRTLTLAVIAAIGLAGCGSLPESKKIDYKSAGRAPSLEIPPDLTTPTADERYQVPAKAARGGSATFSNFAQDRGAAPSAQQSAVLPAIDKVRIERSGSQRWLVVQAKPDQLWGTVKEFWQDVGFLINRELPDAGVMETDWAEDRAKIANDGIRSVLGKVLDSLYSTGERDKFRTRFEPGSEPGTTEIYISHRGMEEVYTSNAKDETRWQPRQANPELEAEMLRRLMVRLGTEEKRAEAMVQQAKMQQDRARLNWTSEVGGNLEVAERFDRAWRRVGLALDRVGFTVEDRDRSKGIYYVRYVDPEAEALKKDPGLLSKLAFWRGGEDKKTEQNKGQYRIYVRDAGEKAVVQVLSPEGGADKSDTGRRILGLLHEQLK